MAGSTINNRMISLQGKSAELMHGACIFNNPAFGIVTPGTIWSQCIVMHIGMTRSTFTFCFLKF
jgi:hypothetical protein